MSVPSTEKCSSDKSAPTSGCAKHRTQELGRDRARQQPVAVLGEHGHVPHRVVDAETHEPAEQQVVVEPCLRLTGLSRLAISCRSERTE